LKKEETNIIGDKSILAIVGDTCSPKKRAKNGITRPIINAKNFMMNP
jgi:hypothetical protein